MSPKRPMMPLVTTSPTANQQNGHPIRLELSILLFGFLAMYAPTYSLLDSTVWNVVGQGHGPVMLGLALWLAWQRWPSFAQLTPAQATLPGSFLFALGLVAYALGHSQDALMLDAGSQILVLSGLCLLYRGWPGLRTMWFPLFFVLFMVPMPAPIVDAVTSPLKSAVSYVAETLLYWAQYPIGRSGVTLTIGPYKLLVADACAGLNSIFALEAIGVFYMSVMQYKNKSRNILLATLIIPISFISNVTRVVALVLVTYYFGDEIGQSFIHSFAGILLFMVATALTIGVDALIGLPITKRKSINKETTKPINWAPEQRK